MTRITARAASVSWIPWHAVSGPATQAAFHMGVMHYDPPPPDTVDDVAALVAADRGRFANELTAWIDVVDGRIVDHGQHGAGHVNVTKVRVAHHGRGDRPATAMEAPPRR